VGVTAEFDVFPVLELSYKVGEGDDRRDRVPLFLFDEAFRLFIRQPHDVGYGYAHLLPFLLVYPSCDGDGLEVYTPDDVAVFDGETDDVANLVVVDAFDEDWN